VNPENPSQVSSALVVPSSSDKASKPGQWTWSPEESREVERRLNERCMREPAAYIPTVWQVLTRGLGVAAGVGLYRWIGKKG
jgi:hypothetical protein